MIYYFEIMYHINTMLCSKNIIILITVPNGKGNLSIIAGYWCPIKVNSNIIEVIVHTSCYYILDLLCVTIIEILAQSHAYS